MAKFRSGLSKRFPYGYSLPTVAELSPSVSLDACFRGYRSASPFGFGVGTSSPGNLGVFPDTPKEAKNFGNAPRYSDRPFRDIFWKYETAPISLTQFHTKGAGELPTLRMSTHPLQFFYPHRFLLPICSKQRTPSVTLRM